MIKSSMDATKDDDQVVLPGFRFHPTDEELVSFYLQRKIEKKLISIEFIKQIDIYKYEPWDLASTLFHTQFDFCLLLIFMIVFYLLRFSFNQGLEGSPTSEETVLTIYMYIYTGMSHEIVAFAW